MPESARILHISAAPPGDPEGVGSAAGAVGGAPGSSRCGPGRWQPGGPGGIAPSQAPASPLDRWWGRCSEQQSRRQILLHPDDLPPPVHTRDQQAPRRQLRTRPEALTKHSQLSSSAESLWISMAHVLADRKAIIHLAWNCREQSSCSHSHNPERVKHWGERG